MLCDGSSMRSISRVADVSINTVTKLLADAGRVALDFHDESVRMLRSRRVQCDETWSFCAEKQKNVAGMLRIAKPTYITSKGSFGLSTLIGPLLPAQLYVATHWKI